MTAPERGYFSVVRWRSNPTRDEARNIAVVLVDAEGQFGGVRPAPPSSLSSDARQQGLLDAILHGLEARFTADERPDLAFLRGLADVMVQSLYLTPPKPVAVPDPDLTLHALYRAYVQPVGAPRTMTKGVVTDRVVHALRRQGFDVRRGEYIGDFLFDAIVGTSGTTTVCNVLSYATTRKNAIPIERDAGHFLYGLEHLGLTGLAVIEPPSQGAGDEVITSHGRVRRWFSDAHVPVQAPGEVTIAEPTAAGSH